MSPSNNEIGECNCHPKEDFLLKSGSVIGGSIDQKA